MTPHITVCICTYKRPELLRKLLERLTAQRTDGRFTYSVVVTDNDRAESARAAVAEFGSGEKLPVAYVVEPEQNIALARNRCLANVKGEFAAFIDDDELPEPDWLLKLLSACEQYRADGVLGPVKPYFEEAPPAWILKGRFCERPSHPTGYVMKWRETRTGNVLLRMRVIEGVAEPFRRQFGNGSEDTDFFRRMIERGGVFVWSEEAVVHEIVPPDRWTRKYMLRRALLRGQNKKHLANVGSISKSLLAIAVYAVLLPFLLVLGHHLFMRYLISLFDHAGKLLAVLGWRPLGDKYLTA